MGRVMSPDKAQSTNLSRHTNRNSFVAPGHLALISKYQNVNLLTKRLTLWEDDSRRHK